MKKREDKLMLEARAKVAELGEVELEELSSKTIGAKPFDNELLIAITERQIERTGRDPYAAQDDTPKPEELYVGLVDKGYENEFLKEAIANKGEADGRDDPEKALEAQAAVNLEIGKQMADAAAKRAERNE